ncbi:hypothetical protein [Sneathiella chinensis]|uniref:Uncharacterized protein n=2 Tax=Sneathiella chinensis TaxID=349750 RepID=A0ABQ5U4K0_9PROT|nr:hypothetical protein [Sneathiella chinensis]GLQ06676.1 hypothetical protein GCM10007924_18970 [Sneathiella chinensis]
MLLATLVLGSALTMGGSAILENEFGIHGDMMPEVAPTHEVPAIDRQYKYRPEGLKPRVSPRNSRPSAPMGNSQFRSPSLGHGSTLPGRGFSSSPTAPSRFSRP